MKVKELIELLKKEDPEAVVRSEGCQMCVHPVTGKETHAGEVWLTVDASR